MDLMLEENTGRFVGKMSYPSHHNPLWYNFLTIFICHPTKYLTTTVIISPQYLSDYQLSSVTVNIIFSLKILFIRFLIQLHALSGQGRRHPAGGYRLHPHAGIRGMAEGQGDMSEQHMRLKFCCTRRQRIILTSWESKSSPLSNLSGRNTPCSVLMTKTCLH